MELTEVVDDLVSWPNDPELLHTDSRVERLILGGRDSIYHRGGCMKARCTSVRCTAIRIDPIHRETRGRTTIVFHSLGQRCTLRCYRVAIP
jgi:hypothetical protein